MAKHVIEENHIHSLDLLHEFYIVGSDVKPALENLKLTILERIELSSTPPKHGGDRLGHFPPENFLVFYKNWNIYAN